MTERQPEEIAHLEKRIAALSRRLRLRETQIAGYGSLDVPPYIVLDKEEAERDLALARAALRRLRPAPTNARPLPRPADFSRDRRRSLFRP